MQRSARSTTMLSILVVAIAATSCQAEGDEVTSGTDDAIDRPAETPPPSSTAPLDDGPAVTRDTADITPLVTSSTAPLDDGPAVTRDTIDTTPLVTNTTTDKQVAVPTIVATETVYEVGMIDRGLAPFVRQATDDLVGRLGVAANEIEVLTAVLVVWPNSALGCPDPEMAYAQVTTDGSVIELGVGGRVYRYHSGGSRGPFLCERPLTTPPTPIAVP